MPLRIFESLFSSQWPNCPLTPETAFTTYSPETSPESLPVEQKREEVAENIIESYKKIPIHEVMHESAHIKEREVEGITLQLSPEEHDSVVVDFYTMMMERGIKNTLRITE